VRRQSSRYRLAGTRRATHFDSFLTVTEIENGPIPMVTVIVLVFAGVAARAIAPEAPEAASLPSTVLMRTSHETSSSAKVFSTSALRPLCTASIRRRANSLSSASAPANRCTCPAYSRISRISPASFLAMVRSSGTLGSPARFSPQEPGKTG
jgi:hypothetical protein